jgi:hypothetical protein
MAYKLRSPFEIKSTKDAGFFIQNEAGLEKDPPPGEPRFPKIRSFIEKQDAKLEENHPNLHKNLSYVFGGMDFPDFRKNKNQEASPQPEAKPEKKGPSAIDKLKTNITTSNFVRKHRKLGNALTNAFYGTSIGKNKNVSGKQWTPREIYKDAMKDERQAIREMPLFSHDRREARKDLRGKYGATTNKEGKIVATSRLSVKNRHQQRILLGKNKGNVPHRGVHTPYIPEIKGTSTQMAANEMSNRQINRHLARGATNYNYTTTQNSTGTSGAQSFCDAKGRCTQVNPNK